MRTRAALVLLAIVATACGHDAPTRAVPAPPHASSTTRRSAPRTTDRGTARTTTTARPAVDVSYVAQATGSSVEVYDTPGAASPRLVLPNPWVVDPARPASTVPQVFLVEPGPARPGWVRVLLPVRPNGSVGWVRAGAVSVARVDYRVRVELGRHAITVSENGRPLYLGPVAVGAPATPTPTGHYYIRVLIQAPNPHTVYGPYAYGLSSHSDALSHFDGGDAEIGIHGNDDASVLGKDVSHGCIRMDNDEIAKLAGLLPLGTPVDVVA